MRLRTGEKLLAPPRQARSVAKRKKLLEAGRRLFAEKGYEATSIADITSRAGTASGAFYTYFRSKRQLLVVLMNELVGRLAGVDLRPQGDLRRFLADVFRADLENFGVIRAWQEASLTDRDLAGMKESIESWTSARILKVFRVMQRSSRARRNRDLVTFARMMDRHFWSLLARGFTMGRQEFERELNLAADVIEHYLLRVP